MDDESSVALRVRGQVQGVFYRASARREASRLGLRGWVRNRSDGSVEAVATGAPEAIAAFRRWCADGPPSARVAAVELLSPDEAQNLPSPGALFEILPTR